jgi:hypothetical protein
VKQECNRDCSNSQGLQGWGGRTVEIRIEFASLHLREQQKIRSLGYFKEFEMKAK